VFVSSQAVSPRTLEDVCHAVAAADRVCVRGGGTKPALSRGRAPACRIDLGGLSGIVEYQPTEYTFTALAGTPVAELQTVLAAHGQALPFDPPLAGRGATLGGTVAAGLSGSGSYRYGGLRDFILGVRFVDGQARIVAGGGKVVKNAAGFDLPKLMVGSLGRLGVLLEITMKVFPRPEAHVTLRLETRDMPHVVSLLQQLGRSTWDLAAVDVIVSDAAPTVCVRLAGAAEALAARGDALRRMLGGEILEDRDDENVWREAADFTWVPREAMLVKVPMTSGRIISLEDVLSPPATARRYAVGGQVLWIAWRAEPQQLDAGLRSLGLTGLVVAAPPEASDGASAVGDWPLIGAVAPGAFGERVKHAIDPTNRFGPWTNA
jgi:glycolate oxidase FAD binding subunit